MRPFDRLLPFLALSVLAVFATSAACAAPKAAYSTMKVDFGKVRQGKVLTEVVDITNAGDAPLEIQRVQSSCPCASASLPEPVEERTIAPGATFPLTITYDTKDLMGERSGGIVISTTDPEVPSVVIELAVDIEALVLTRPDKVFHWGMVPLGDEIPKELVIFPGTQAQEIELLEARMAHDTMTVTTKREETGNGPQISAKFRVSPNVPLGPISNEIFARVRVDNEEATITLPVQGEVVGDVLVVPQSIVCAPRLAYTQNQPLSEEGIIVRASREGAPLPEILGVVAVGPLQCIIHKNVKPDWGDRVDRHIIEVRTAANAQAGAHGGTVYVMTTSKDQPIVTIPVFFRMDSRVTADPPNVVLEPGDAPAVQRIVLTDSTGATLEIRDIKLEEDLLEAHIETKQGTAVALTLSATSVPSAERRATIVSVMTDQPGAERVLIPVLIRASEGNAPTTLSSALSAPSESTER